jgi:methylenetetrahydrofolate dehydrogenase (NADP+)/methenyltetrahydrofolate cyclohydrolase
MNIIDGQLTAKTIRQEIAQAVLLRKETGKKVPHLAAILVGDNPASLAYVSNKVKACEEVGFTSTLLHLDAGVTQVELISKVKALNDNPDIDGYIVQLPLPAHLDEHAVLETIDFKKDVDGFHPENLGRMALGLSAFLPATPAGIVELLRRYRIPTQGKHCVIMGRSHIVGMPMSLLMQKNSEPGNCTVTVVHSKTPNIKEICLQADILIAAIGKPRWVTQDMIKPGAVVIDVGINRVEDKTKKSGFSLVGDVDFEHVAPLCSYITPVPGGVGPMTIASLMINTLQAATRKDNA